MSKFNSSYKRLLTSDASHAWSFLHCCVECFARTTGETFTSIFERLEVMFSFKRNDYLNWPNLKSIIIIATYLKLERDAFLAKMKVFIAKRKQEKRKGIRITSNEFLPLLQKQTRYIHTKTYPRNRYYFNFSLNKLDN